MIKKMSALLMPALFFSFLLSNCNAEIKAGISQIDYSNFPEFSAYVIVINENGNFITGLEKENFIVTEDGIPVEVTNTISVEDLGLNTKLPLSIVLALDNSSSMQGKEHDLEKAANLFIENLNPYDRVAIVQYQHSLSGGAQTVNKLSTDKESLKKRTSITNFVNKTYLYDAIYLSTNLLEGESPLGRRAIVVFSDGKDIGSHRSFKETVLYAQAVETPVFSIELGKGVSRNKNLIEISQETGGDYYFSPTPEGLIELYAKIKAQLFKQYRISYVSDNTNITDEKRNVNITINIGNDKLVFGKSFILDKNKVKLATAVYKGSKEELIALINQFPESKWVDDMEHKLARLYEEEGNYTEAQKHYEELIRRFPESQWTEESLFRLGNTYSETGDTVKALKTFQQLIQSFPNHQWTDNALLEIGKIHAAQGNCQKAEDTFTSLSTKFPESILNQKAPFILGKAYFHKGKFEKSEMIYEKIISDYPHLTCEAQYEIALIKEKTGHPSEAIDLCKKILQNSKDNTLKAKAQYRIAYIHYNNENWEKTKENLLPFKTEFLDSDFRPNALFLLGETYLRENNSEDAEAIYAILRVDYPNHALTARIPEKTEEQHGELKFEQYVVKKGDCLWNISRKFLGDGREWQQLYQINEGEISDPHFIYVNQKINIVTRENN